MGVKARALCTRLGIEYSKWQAKRELHLGDVKETCFDCLTTYWLQDKDRKNVTWSAIIDALRSAECGELAEHYEQKILNRD